MNQLIVCKQNYAYLKVIKIKQKPRPFNLGFYFALTPTSKITWEAGCRLKYPRQMTLPPFPLFQGEKT